MDVVHGTGLHGRRRDLRLRGLPARAAARLSDRPGGLRLGSGLVVREIARHGGDPGRVFIGGHSAGGHYAALLSVNGRALASAELPRSTIRGCLPVSGVFDFGPSSGLSMRPRFLGADLRNDVAASPIVQIETPLPPFLVAYGSNDFAHLVPQGRAFVAALRDAGAVAEGIEMAERTHFTASFAGGEAGGPWVPAALEFMARHARSR